MLIQKRKGKKIEKEVRERKRNLIYVEVPIFGHCAKNIFCKYALLTKQLMVYLVAQTVKNLPAMQETRLRSLSWEYPLEKRMATHFSILVWRTPWTEEPGGLQSMRSQRVGHD